ncbi:FAD/NAD(P)-binding protein [Swaminathania salitolerans]|uniref:Hydroxyacylglutathione hydrolase n=1 Tax=Swaminathania salitolerans TaxID=182838 RepID=A0A511BSU0_9PROT|nr:FAD/NAD(P)-binding protein [Swaminathania salitolerans]GBQ12829.1 hydroxyacylglutathione hydrolase [Swaminathania salitolerans LMG 21291]GEL03182.1 hydroxyacylglutathione hydrolase [Swaminathania salitolerans]
MNNPSGIVIIGGGASATLLAHALRRTQGRDCLIVDPSPRFALGAAYGTRCIGHLLNVPASGMSGLAEAPDHFVRWLHRQIDPGIAPGAFIPRALYGLYIEQLLQESGATLLRDEVVSCRMSRTAAGSGGYRLRLGSGREIDASTVVLALGHFPPAPIPGLSAGILADPRYVNDVWREGARISGPDEPLVLIGSGLTAIDMVMKARLEGHRGTICLLSRHARLPEAHRPEAHRPKAQRPEAHRSEPLPDVPVIDMAGGDARLGVCVRQFHDAIRSGVPWRAAVDSLRSVSNSLWQGFSAAERARFDRHLRRRWDIARHRIAPQIASFLHNEQQAGTLELHAGRVTGITADQAGLTVTAIHNGRQSVLRAGRVLNCTGPDLRYDRVGSPLLDDLFSSGLARPGHNGMGLDTDETGRLTARPTGKGDRSGSALYTLGPARLGTMFESIAIPEIRQQAYDLAAELAARLRTASSRL